MSFFVVPIPDPAPGAEWSYTIPGQYVEDITVISATLFAGGVPGFPSCHDASGNHNDAQYGNAGSTFVAGLVPGNDALQRNAGNGDQIVTPYPITDISSAFTYVEWIELDAPGPNSIQLGGYADSVLGHVGWVLSIPVAFPHRFFLTGVRNAAGGATIFQTANGTVPYDSAPHMLAVTFDPTANPQNTLYLDGVALAWSGTDAPFFYNGPANGWAFNVGYSPLVTDEISILPGALSSAQVADLYAAGASFATYEPAVAAATPVVWYHLDNEITPPGGRQVALAVTDGTNEVLDIPTGFAETTNVATSDYSWQSNLNSSTQAANGQITTVAIPRLILPAGYTVGSRTFDLAASDQWTNIRVWWDDTYQQGTVNFEDYGYAPGYYTYQRQGS